MINKLLLIPDTQVKPGVPMDHLYALGEEIVDVQPDYIVHIGDHWDMPSLSSYDKGSAKAEGKRVVEDILSGNDGMEALLTPLKTLQATQRVQKKRVYQPKMYFLMGNHENRIKRYENQNPALEGFMDDRLNLDMWEVVPFLQTVEIGGISFAHYFYNPNSGKPFGGSMEYRLSKVKRSFVQGHEQGLKYAQEAVGDKRIHGLMAGAFYLHDEDYKGPQGNNHWRGYCYLNNIVDGDYDLEVRRIR